MPPLFRRLSPEDSIEELTDLLHRAYAPLAAAGMRFVASHQGPDVTRRRIAGGECWVAVSDGLLVATVTLEPPGRGSAPEGGGEHYARADVAKLQQFAVDPGLKGQGVGSALLDLCEARARELGAAELALDTSEHATALLSMYRRRGFRVVEPIDWRPHVNYKSVVLSKTL